MGAGIYCFVQERDFKRWRSQFGDEYFNYPSPFAMRVWPYVRCVGKTHHDASFRMNRSNEDGFLLHFVTRGALWHRIGDKNYLVRAGDACLLDLTTQVTYGTEGKSVELYWVWCNGKDLPLVANELQTDQNPVFDAIDKVQLKNLFRALMRLTAKQPPAYETRAAATLISMLAVLQSSRFSASHASALDGSSRPLSDPIRRAIWYIKLCYQRPLAIKEIADRAAHTSEAQFSRLFHREVGVSPTIYLSQFRVQQAKRLLEATSRPIEDIARAVGFSDPDYFTRVFTRAISVSPRQYRKKSQRGA